MTRHRNPRGEMPFLDHLEELRWRLLKVLIAVAAGVVAGYALVTHFDFIALLKTPIDPFLPAGQRLLFTSPLDPFMLTLKLALVVGLLIASPVLLWIEQKWPGVAVKQLSGPGAPAKGAGATAGPISNTGFVS